MTFEVEIAGRMRTCVIERVGADAAHRFRVTVDGDPVEVDCTRTDLGLSCLFLADGRSVDVAITDRPNGEWLAQLPHVDIVAEVDRRRNVRHGAADGADRPGEQRVLAPMPGRIVRVLVKPGDEVAVRQGLIVVEAMKMENELGSPKAGRVKEVSVTEGTSVEAGRLLVIVE